MQFFAPILHYAQLAPMLIVLAGALIGVLIEAFAPRSSRHSSQLFITLFLLYLFIIFYSLLVFLTFIEDIALSFYIIYFILFMFIIKYLS
jgi:hypothetical protein